MTRVRPGWPGPNVDGCFPSIPRWPVLERLRELVPDVELIGLVEKLITRPVLGDGKGDARVCLRAVRCPRCWPTSTSTPSTGG